VKSYQQPRTYPNDPTTGFQAFRQGYNETPPVMADQMFTGLTKREHFAGLALQGILANPDVDWAESAFEDIANDAVAYADALIEALNGDAA
jgi:hypothetical protein